MPECQATGRAECPTDTLYYDGACPLCSREMAHLRAAAPACELKLVDIHSLDLDARDPQRPDKESLLQTLHLQTCDGQWLTGLDANIYAWRSTPWGKYWRLLELPVIHWISRRIYDRWAKLRYRRIRAKANTAI